MKYAKHRVRKDVDLWENGTSRVENNGVHFSKMKEYLLQVWVLLHNSLFKPNIANNQNLPTLGGYN